MEIRVERFVSDFDATLSLIFIDGDFVCFGLEDEYRSEKVLGETRIPSGSYKLGVRQEGGFHKRYSSKFPMIHKGMLQVLDVPNFEYVLIHVGNTDEDTAGCLLLGQRANAGFELSIQSSVSAYVMFYERVIDEALKGNVTIHYLDYDKRGE